MEWLGEWLTGVSPNTQQHHSQQESQRQRFTDPLHSDSESNTDTNNTTTASTADTNDGSVSSSASSSSSVNSDIDYDYDEDDDYADYDVEDMLDSEMLFGTCDVEKKIYLDCLRDSKTLKTRGWRKYWYPEWTLLKNSCFVEAKELDLCTLLCEWRQKVVYQSCSQVQKNYQACISVSSRGDSLLNERDCLPAFAQFMACARTAIEQREFEQNFSIR